MKIARPTKEEEHSQSTTAWRDKPSLFDCLPCQREWKLSTFTASTESALAKTISLKLEVLGINQVNISRIQQENFIEMS